MQVQVAPTDLAKVPLTAPVEAALVIWTTKLRIDHVVIFQANGSRAFKAAGSIDLGAVEDLGVIDLVAGDSVAGVIALAAADLEGLAGSAAAAADDDEINAWNFPILFPEMLKPQTNHLRKDMKKLLTLTSIASIGAVLALISANQASGAGAGEISRKEALLTQSGFKIVTVTDPKQKQAVNGIAQGRCSAVTFNKKLFYVFPTAKKDKIYVGKQAQFDKYKKAIAAHQASKPATL